MTKMVCRTSTFEKMFKKYQYHTEVITRLENFINELLAGMLDAKRKNHKLGGPYMGYYEAHLFPDVLVIYKLVDDTYVFAKIGSHSDLFG